LYHALTFLLSVVTVREEHAFVPSSFLILAHAARLDLWAGFTSRLEVAGQIAGCGGS